jgi:hypothetical protein
MKGGCVGHRGFTLGYDYLRLSNACVRLPLFCKVPLENNEAPMRIGLLRGILT